MKTRNLTNRQITELKSSWYRLTPSDSLPEIEQYLGDFAFYCKYDFAHDILYIPGAAVNIKGIHFLVKSTIPKSEKYPWAKTDISEFTHVDINTAMKVKIKRAIRYRNGPWSTKIFLTTPLIYIYYNPED